MPKVTIFKTFDITRVSIPNCSPILSWPGVNTSSKLFKTTLPISFQFHHAQMDGFEAARFLNGQQETVNGLTIR